MGDMELEIFSERLKELRLSLGLTQAQFVEDLGITASALSAYEKNSKNPSISVAKRISEKYNISIDWLCGLSDKKENNEEPQTYADVIDLLVKIQSALKFDVDEGHANMILIHDSVVAYFLEDWAHMLSLYKAGTIDKKLYMLWIDDKMKEFMGTHLRNEDEIEDLLSYLKFSREFH